MILNIVFSIILPIISIILFFLGSKVKGWKKILSINLACVFLVITIVLTVNSAKQITRLEEEVKEEKKRVETTSLNLFGYEIQGDKIGKTRLINHSAVPRVRAMVQAFYDKQYKQVDSMCDSLISDYPFFAGAYFWKGAVAIAEGRDAKCESLWTIAVELEPKNIAYALLYRNIGIIRMKIGNKTKAIEAFNTALSVALIVDEIHKAKQEQGKKPDTRISVAECYFLIARAYEAAGQKDSTDIFLKKATNLNPEWKKRWNEQIKIITPR